VDGEIDRGHSDALVEPREHRWHPRIGEGGDEQMVERTRLGQADPPAGHRLRRTRERQGADRPKRVVPIAKRRRVGHGRQWHERFGGRYVRRHDVAELHATHREGEGGLTCRQETTILQHATAREGDAATRSLDARLDLHGSFDWWSHVVLGERSRRAGGIGDMLGERPGMMAAT
jgi:hypothetical protein